MSSVAKGNLWDQYRQTQGAVAEEAAAPLMLSLEWRDGRRHLLSYPYLLGIAYDPLGKLRLDFTAYRVELSRVGLERLLIPLSLQQTACLRESEVPAEQVHDQTYILEER
jgi:hypothetical protein